MEKLIEVWHAGLLFKRDSGGFRGFPHRLILH